MCEETININNFPEMEVKVEEEDMEDEELQKVAIEGDEELHEVAIEGDGDCFYSAIVEAFNRNGRDLADLPEAEVKISLNHDQKSKLQSCGRNRFIVFSFNHLFVCPVNKLAGQ